MVRKNTNQQEQIQSILPELQEKETMIFKCHDAPTLGDFNIFVD
jgi:hypothetical protein